MAKLIKATPVVKGKDASRIVRELQEGTPDTPKRIETIRRADEVFAKTTRRAQGWPR